MGDTVIAKCAHCDGEMTTEILPRFSPAFGIAILIIGLLFSVLMSLLLGLPIVVIGAYLAGATRVVWRCPACGALADRADRD